MYYNMLNYIIYTSFINIEIFDYIQMKSEFLLSHYDFHQSCMFFPAEQAAVAGLSWGELVEEEELREPGRAVQMHEKLSSPSRKR